MVYMNTWSTLEKYANSLVEQAVRVSAQNNRRVSFDTDSLESSELLLQNQWVHFTVYNARNAVVFPDNVYMSKINTRDWKKLQKGEIVHKVADRNVNRQNGQPQPAMTDILKPYFYTNNKGNKRLIAVIRVGAFISDINTNINQINKNLIRPLIISSLVALGFAFLLASFSNMRINRLRRATKQVAKGNYDVKLKTNHRDEIDDLTNDFNGMISSLRESREEIKHQEERRRTFMADAAHEMRTPLTTINGLLEGLAYDAIPEESKEQSIKLMRDETNRLIRLVNENLDYENIRANKIRLNKQEFDAVDAFTNLVEQLQRKAEAKKMIH